MNDLMVDIETLGTKPGSPVIAIGAVFFDIMSGELGERFYGKIDVEDAMRYSRISGDTFKWWMAQNDAARREATSGFMSANEVFADFYNFMSVNANLGKMCPWGNGASFDITILEVSFERILGKPAPWKFWNVQDVRTIKRVGESVGHKYPHDLKGVAHKAIDDAIHQAKYVAYYWQKMHGKTPDLSDGDVVDDFADFDGAADDTGQTGSDLDDLDLDLDLTA